MSRVEGLEKVVLYQPLKKLIEDGCLAVAKGDASTAISSLIWANVEAAYRDTMEGHAQRFEARADKIRAYRKTISSAGRAYRGGTRDLQGKEAGLRECAAELRKLGEEGNDG